MSTALYYQRPIALDRERHAKTKVAVAANHSAFTTKSNALPIAGSEFFEAAKDYPIVFVKDADERCSASILVGLRDDENLFVDKQGNWEESTYLPAFVRRYPFVPSIEQGTDRLTIFIDEAYSGLNEQKGESLFDPEGTESPYLLRMLEFISLFHREIERTRVFSEKLDELGLLTPKIINVERAGERQFLQGLWVVDEAKYRGIEDSVVVELFREGFLPWIEAHLLSLGQVNRLLARLPLPASE